jgi:plastocyanin domain-containing protein
MFRKLTKTLLALSLVGAALSASGCARESTAGTPASAAPAPGGVRKVAIQVTANGYEPSPIALRKDEPVELTLTRTTDETCATEIVLEEYGINTKLPLNQAVTVRFTPTKAGELRYGCAMGKMVSGVLQVQ